MKKSTLFIALLLCTSFAMAQKGSLWLGGSFGYEAIDQAWWNGSVQTQNLSVCPSLEYFVAETWSVYAGVGVDYTRQSKLDNFQGTNAGPLVGAIKYFPITERFSIYTELGMMGSWGSAKDDLTKYKFSGYQVGFVPGVNFMLTEKICIGGSFGMIGYHNRTCKDKNSGHKDTYKRFSADLFSQGISLGMQFRLN